MEWIENNNTLEKTFKFKSFELAMQWMNNIAQVISEMDHHPEWTNVYNRVKVSLTTHSAGNAITDKDRKLASAMDSVYEEMLKA